MCSIKYNSEGKIYSDNNIIENDIDVILNLNSEKHLLKLNRKSMLKQVREELCKMQKRGIWGRNVLEKVKNKYINADENGYKKEYAGVAIWYIDKKLNNTTSK